MRYYIIISTNAQNFKLGTCFTEREVDKLIAKRKTTQDLSIINDIKKYARLGEISQKKTYSLFGARLISEEELQNVKWL